ncbi:MAG: hypothetical protein BWY67_02488 [Bacteroidetes bacterium ADurb.Bin397]|nr:MAG: hypothetical protein BWY67_02488 [Bacteroidetes bacterium ADurb.Bin397]
MVIPLQPLQLGEIDERLSLSTEREVKLPVHISSSVSLAFTNGVSYSNRIIEKGNARNVTKEGVMRQGL